MPLNAEDSFNELRNYRQFYSTFHSSYELSPENFIKVPPKTIIVSTFHDNEISSHDQEKIYLEMLMKKNYLLNSLLTENDNIPEYHKFHNKTIYMPGSCIPNIALEFIKESWGDRFPGPQPEYSILLNYMMIMLILINLSIYIPVVFLIKN